MIKLRIQGKPEEVQNFISELKKGNFEILEESSPYSNRGNSTYIRSYLDVEPKYDKEEK